MRALIFEDTPPPTDHHAYPNIPDSPPAAVSYDWEARRQLFRQLTSPDTYGWTNLHNVTAPTLLIAGSGEDYEQQEATRRLPAAELIVIEAGHWIHETQEAFVEAIRAFPEH